MRPELPTASVVRPSATPAAVDNSAPLQTRPSSLIYRGWTVQTNRATSKLLLERAAELFDRRAAPEPVDLKPLHAKIGQQALELDFLNSALTKAGLLSAGK